MGTQPRLRMFAGPNGSGKSTLKEVLPPKLLGVYLNPDELEKELGETGSLDPGAYGLAGRSSELLERTQQVAQGRGGGLSLRVETGKLVNEKDNSSPYLASYLSESIRQLLMESRISMTLETVMSHRSKIEFLRSAQEIGFRTYLYFVATENVEINISRVRARVALGGHRVPEDKIRARYERSLGLLLDAIKWTNRAYLFDNSQHGPQNKTWIAEVNEGQELRVLVDTVPAWIQHRVLDQI